MAADAFTNAQKKMETTREQEIAALIMRDIDLRRQKAEENGVLAYAKMPITRGRPNERFLQNTLKSVGFANRKAAEDQMWAQWNSKKRQQGEGVNELHHRKRARRDSSSTEPHSEDYQSDSESSQVSSGTPSPDRRNSPVASSSASKPVRGRGAVGSRADEMGPYLFPTDQQEREEYDMMRHKKVIQGPARPQWLRDTAPEPSQPSRPSRSEIDLDEEILRQASRIQKQARKEKKKAKKLKKEKRRRHKVRQKLD